MRSSDIYSPRTTEESYRLLGSWPTLGAQKAEKIVAMDRDESWMLGSGARIDILAPSKDGE